MRQGAVGAVRLVERGGRRLVEKRLADPARHENELRALRGLVGSGLPVPEVSDALDDPTRRGYTGGTGEGASA